MSGEMGRSRRVVIVDDNDLTAAGFATALTGLSGIDLVATLGHTAALCWSSQWEDIDVALVDAADERLAGDNFPGVQVVKRIRACQGSNRPVVAVVTGHFFNDGLRHRMAAADADFFFLRLDVRTAGMLRDFVLHPESFRRGVPRLSDPAAARDLGITARTRVDEFVDYVEAQGLEKAFDPDDPSRDNPRSRKWLRHRRSIGEAAHIAPVNLTTGWSPTRTQFSPSLRQLRSIYRWAARVPRADEPSPDPYSDG